MRKLLSTGLYRLRKDILFWIAVIGCAISGIVFTVFSPNNYDDMFTIPVHVLIAAFVSLFCGREYSDGTIRNKVICGHSKGQIYLSALFINDGACLIMAAAFLLTHIALRLTVFRIHSVLTAGDWVLCAVNFVLGCLVYTSIFTFVSMLVPNKTLSAIINLAIMFVFLFSSYQLEFRLGQPATRESEYMSGYRELTPEEMGQVTDGTFEDAYDVLTANDGREIYFCRNVTTENYPNPDYLQGPLRTILETVDRMLPPGQINMYMSYLTDSMIWHAEEFVPVYDTEQAAVARSLPIYSISAILLFSVLGCLLYRKKELK